MILKRFQYFLAALLLLPLEMAAQPQPWNNVKTISPGTLIRVNGPRPGAVSGTLLSSSDDSLVLNSKAGQETFDRQKITRVSVKKQGHRGRNTLIGLGVGAGVGLGLGAASDSSCGPNNCFFGNNFGKTVLTPIGAGFGALIGAILPSGGWREIYKQ